jgi:tetratricopeptide (TPR) repeat protein
VEGVAEKVAEHTSPIKPAWQRWNDYGIGCLIEGGAEEKRGELRQAEKAFETLLKEHPDQAGVAHLNLARVYDKEGRLAEERKALEAARKAGAPWWTVAWFNGLLNLQNVFDNKDLDAAIANFRLILDPGRQPRERDFDFTKDYVVINALGRALFYRAQSEGDSTIRARFLREAIEQYEQALRLDIENLSAHYGLQECFRMLARAMPRLKPDESDVKTDEAAMRELSRVLLDGKADKTARLQGADRLARAITALGGEPVSASHPKRIRFEILRNQIAPYFHRETDADLQAAAAHVLDKLHGELHAIFKPDDIAQSRAVQEHRKKHPAANHAAEPVVIYPLNRKDAPGLGVIHP